MLLMSRFRIPSLYVLPLLALLPTAAIAARERLDSLARSENAASAVSIPTPTIGLLAQVTGRVYDNRILTVTDMDVRLVRLSLSGGIGSECTYRFQGDIQSSYKMLDLILSYAVTPDLRLDVGQFKAPYGNEWLVDDDHIPFVNRSLIAQNMNPLRQRGAALRLSLLDRRLQLAGGIFNGNGQAIDNKISLFCATATAAPVAADGFGIDCSGSFAYSNDPNDLLWLGNRLDHTLMLGGSAKLRYVGSWIELENSAVLFNGEMTHGYRVDVGTNVNNLIECIVRTDFLNYFSQNTIPATVYFPLTYDKQYWIGMNVFPAPGIKIQIDYQRDEVLNTNAGYLNLQYSIHTR
jgi:hypothetical protein